MNKGNLLRMADYAETIRPELFNIAVYRQGQCITPECDSIGCLIGHCTILDTKQLPINFLGIIDFYVWINDFAGLMPGTPKWHWCFSPLWVDVDNTPTGAAARIRYLVEHGLPENWRMQMHGEEPICYK